MPVAVPLSLGATGRFSGRVFSCWETAWISEKENIYSRKVWPDCSRRIKLLLQLLVLHPHSFNLLQEWAFHHCPAQYWETLLVKEVFFLIFFSAIQFKYSKD